VNLKEEHYLPSFPKEEIVYLTGDAEEDLNEIENEYI